MLFGTKIPKKKKQERRKIGRQVHPLRSRLDPDKDQERNSNNENVNEEINPGSAAEHWYLIFGSQI